MLSFYLFRRYFLSSRSTSLIRVVAWICLFGLAVSVAALILITSIMGGFGKAITSRLISNEPHLIIDLKENPFFNNKQELSFIKQKHKGIQETIFFETQDLIVKTPLGFKGVVATGYTLENLKNKVSEFNLFSFEPLESSLTDTNFKKGKRDILLNYTLFRELNLNIGDELTLIPLKSLLLPPSMVPPIKKVRVKTVVEDDNRKSSGFSIFYERGVLDFGRYSQIKYGAEVKLQDPENYVFYQDLFKDYKFSSWVDRNSTLFFALKLEKFMMTLFIVLAIIISCLGISSALFLLMTQKGKDIGILHAMGLSQQEIIRTFTRLGFYLALMGIFLGLFVGVSGSAFFKFNRFDILPSMYQDRTIPAIFDPLSYLLIVSGAILLAWMACYLPTRHLSRIKPAELLKITGR